ncbi:MAG: ABC transporter permease [Planctomycetota bacterium]
MPLSDGRVVARSLLGRRFSSITTVLTVSIAVALLLTILSMRDAAKQTLQRGAGNMHLVVSAEPSPLVSVLNGLFHAGTPSQVLTWVQVQQLQRDPRLAYAIPIQQGDSYADYPVTAVPAEFFEKFSPDAGFDPDAPDAGRRWGLSQGRGIADRFEVVLGDRVARETGLDLGDTIVLTCGLAGAGFVHGDFEYEVVGVLEPSGTSHDRVVFADLVSGWIIHAHDRLQRQNPGETIELTEESLTTADRLVTGVYVRGVVRPGRQASAAIAELAAELRRNPTITVASPSAEIDALFRIVSRVDQVLLAMAAAVLVAGAVSIMLALYSATEQRRREIATFRVLGASGGRIVRWVLAEAVLLGCAGVVLGVVLSLAGGWAVAAALKAQLGLVVDPTVSPAAIGWIGIAAVLLAALAGIAPALLAYRTSVAMNLRPLG